MVSVPQKSQDERPDNLFTHHEKIPSKQVIKLNQKRMQEHTKKPALSHNKARNYPTLFPGFDLFHAVATLIIWWRDSLGMYKTIDGDNTAFRCLHTAFDLLTDRSALSNSNILEAFGLKNRRRFRDTYINPSLADGLVEPAIPEKNTSRLQAYRLTEKGRRLLEQLDKDGGRS